MRNIIWLVLLFVVAVVAATTLGSNDGLVSLYWAGWRTDLSLNLFVLLLLLGCLLVMSAVQAMHALLTLPKRASQWRALQRERAAQAALREALSEHFGARYGRAHKAAPVSYTHLATLAELPQGAVVGTSSLRRVVQLLARRPDLRIEPLRGNLDTRLRKLDEGGYDAIVLAAAGLKRLGLSARIRCCFEADQMIPAAGQGALGIEVREDATALRELLAQTIHLPTFLAAHAERAVSRELGGSCSMPLAAHGVWQAGVLQLSAALGDAAQPTQPLLRSQVSAAVTDEAQARALGARAVAQLRAAGAASYLPAAH